MHVLAVAVKVRVDKRSLRRGHKTVRNIADKTGEIHEAEHDQHESDGELHPQADARRDHQSEEDDSGSHHQDGQRMSDAPAEAGQRCPPGFPLLGNDSGDGNDVIGIGGMPYAQNESQSEDGEKADQWTVTSVTACDITARVGYAEADGRRYNGPSILPIYGSASDLGTGQPDGGD
jgi:hypothetical protein